VESFADEVSFEVEDFVVGKQSFSIARLEEGEACSRPTLGVRAVSEPQHVDLVFDRYVMRGKNRHTFSIPAASSCSRSRYFPGLLFPHRWWSSKRRL
jgi:hypothetical protein